MNAKNMPTPGNISRLLDLFSTILAGLMGAAQAAPSIVISTTQASVLTWVFSGLIMILLNIKKYFGEIAPANVPIDQVKEIDTP